MSELPSGTVTFLFTDMEGSTNLAQQNPEAMPTLLARHHAILHQAIESHNGYVFQIIGDSFHAAFHTVSDALAAALDAQRELVHEPWHPTAVKVRMGINTGTAQAGATDERAGGYTGYLTLTRAERVMSLAHGGQILLSNASAELVRGELPPGVTLRDMQEHRLKGLLNPEQIWQVDAPDLPQDFPPLASLNAIPNNLPRQLTSFIGREREMAELQSLLSTHPLITLTGAGGAGKTRLALQVAAEAIDQFEQGVWFVDLAPLSDSALVPQTVMNALGLREEAGRAPLDALTDYLHAKKLLLVLDNCEHLLDACARVAHHLLTHCPNLKLLATSREGLGVAGEVTYTLPSLTLPDPRSLTLQTLSQYDAVRLFIERALAVQPNFAVTNANAPAVAQICVRLDGIPLAIELAAARSKLFSPEQIAARLDDRFHLLTGGSRTAMPRQQTLRAAMDWSYGLLSEPERILFRRLSVFAGGWTFEAAEEVCAGDGLDALEMLDLLGHLVDKSLVATEARAGEARYRLLETLRQYAHEKLLVSGEGDPVRARHLDFFFKLVEEAEPKLQSGQRDVWLDHLEIEIDNLRSALQWSLANQAAQEKGLRLAGELMWFWDFRNYFSEGREWLTTALKATGGRAEKKALAKALSALGWLTRQQSEFAEARTLLQESVALWRELQDRQGLAYALTWLGIVALNLGDMDGAHAATQEAVELWRGLGDTWGLAWALGRQGYLAMAEFNRTAALSLFRESEKLWRQVQDDWGLAFVLWQEGSLATYQFDFAQAHASLEQAQAIYRKAGHKKYIVQSLSSLAELAAYEGNYARAKTLAEEALQMAQELGFKFEFFYSLLILGDVAWLQDDYAHAARYYQDAATHPDLVDKFGIGMNVVNLGYVALQQGEPQRAADLFAESLRKWREIDDARALAAGLIGHAAVAVVTGRFEHAVRLFGAAQAEFEAIDIPMAMTERKEYERYIAMARAQLDEETFAKIFLEGRALTMEQGVAVALRGAQ